MSWLHLRKLLKALLLDGAVRPEAISAETWRRAAALLDGLMGDLDRVEGTDLERARALNVNPSTLWRHRSE